MQLQFSDIQGKDAGKTGFVLGLGPSLANHLHELMLITNEKEKYKIVSCNNIDRLTQLAFDYWVIAQPGNDNSAFGIRNAFNRFNGYPKTTLLYTDCLDLTDRATVDRLLNIDYIGYDQRHFKGMPCTWGSLPGGRHSCCEHIIPERLCIQEVLQQVTKSESHYSTGDTVGVHMLATAVIAGMNPIYITGIDLDYTNGYVNNDLPDTPERISMGMSSVNNSPEIVKSILSDFAKIRDMAKNIGVEIYCLDKGLKISEIFPYKEFPGKELFFDNANPIIGIRDSSPDEQFDIIHEPQNLIPGGTIDDGSVTVTSGAGAFTAINSTATVNNTPAMPQTEAEKSVTAENLKDIPAAYTGKFKPDDEYDWTLYPGEYAKQLEEIKANDGQEFFITDFEGSISASDINNNEQKIVFKNNLHNNWKEVYHQAFRLNVKSVFEVGVGGGYQIRNIKKILPDAEVYACDITQGQIEKARAFSELSDEQMENIKLLDFTTFFPVHRQYEFVFSHAVVMHQGTANAVAMLRNMARISSKYIMLVEGVANHENWYELVKAVLPDWNFELTAAYIDYGILLTRKIRKISPGPETAIQALHLQSNTVPMNIPGIESPNVANEQLKSDSLRPKKFNFEGEMLRPVEIACRINEYQKENNGAYFLHIVWADKSKNTETLFQETDPNDFIEPVGYRSPEGTITPVSRHIDKNWKEHFTPILQPFPSRNNESEPEILNTHISDASIPADEKNETEELSQTFDKEISDIKPKLQANAPEKEQSAKPVNEAASPLPGKNNTHIHKKGKKNKKGKKGQIVYEKKIQEQPEPEESTIATTPTEEVPPELNSIKAEEPVFVFTEIIGCAEVGKVALQSFHKHHDHKVHIYTTEQDIKDLGDIAGHHNNVFIVVPQQVVDLFSQGHAGTAYLFAEVFTGKVDPEINNVVHFDSDVYFKKECLSHMKILFNQGEDIIGTRRCYVNNPANIPVEPGTPDTVSTYFFGMRRSVVPQGYSFEQLTSMFLGHNIGLDHDVFDFADCIVFHALKGGAKIYFLPAGLFGGQNQEGSKATYNPSNLHIDAGDYLIHFGGAGSGCVFYNNPDGKNESYGKWAVIRYKLFCELFFEKVVSADAGETQFDKAGRWVSGNYDKQIYDQIKLNIN